MDDDDDWGDDFLGPPFISSSKISIFIFVVLVVLSVCYLAVSIGYVNNNDHYCDQRLDIYSVILMSMNCAAFSTILAVSLSSKYLSREKRDTIAVCIFVYFAHSILLYPPGLFLQISVTMNCDQHAASKTTMIMYWIIYSIGTLICVVCLCVGSYFLYVNHFKEKVPWEKRSGRHEEMISRMMKRDKMLMDEWRKEKRSRNYHRYQHDSYEENSESINTSTTKNMILDDANQLIKALPHDYYVRLLISYIYIKHCSITIREYTSESLEEDRYNPKCSSQQVIEEIIPIDTTTSPMEGQVSKAKGKSCDICNGLYIDTPNQRIHRNSQCSNNHTSHVNCTYKYIIHSYDLHGTCPHLKCERSIYDMITHSISSKIGK